MLALIESTLLGVKALLTNALNLVWSGGLRNNIDGEESPLFSLSSFLYALTSSDSSRGSAEPPGPSRSSLPNLLSLNNVRQSLYLDRKIAPEELSKTGDSSRRRLYQMAGLAIPSSVRN